MAKQDNFNSIFKSTFLFGGSQVVGLFVALLRNKFAAVFLGAAGLGLNGIYLTTINLIKSITSLGINESAVREIALANKSNDKYELGRIYAVFKFWVYLTGAIGLLALLLFAPLISQFAFKSDKHALDFQILALSFIFGALSGGISTYLRGIQEIKLLASSNALGAIVGLAFTIPFYYFLNERGIVPSIIATSIVNLIIAFYFKKKFVIEEPTLTLTELFKSGAPMIKLGLSLSTVTILSSAVNFVLISFITKSGGLHDVGLYNAGVSIIEFYIGMVFTSIAADFFPRLSGMIHEEEHWKKLVNEQMELAYLLLTLGSIILISSAPFLIRILLSVDLIDSINFIYAAILYLPFKVLVWIPGFLLIAKGENRLFLTIEFVGNILLLVISLLMYHVFGIVGLGYALSLYYIISSLATYYIMLHKFQLRYSKKVYALFVLNVLVIIIGLVLKTQWKGAYGLGVELIFAVLVTGFTLFLLNKRINLRVFVDKFLNKFKKSERQS